MGARFQDYYQTLGVPRDASSDDIKLAFRKLARLYHPDVAKNKVTGEAKFKEVNEANEVLSDPEKRKRYDEFGVEGPGTRENDTNGFAGSDPRGRPQAPPQGEPDFEFSGTGFSDFFESYFARGRSGRDPFQEARGASTRAGADVQADILVTLEEALRGSLRKVTLRRPATAGSPERLQTYQVRIPKGVYEGQLIRLAGQGGEGGGGAGDLYLCVRLARHPDFDVEESDLLWDLALAPWEAVLGVKVPVPVLGGSVSLRVPPGSAQGNRLRLRGMGLPKADGTRGELYATVSIRIPDTVAAEERVLWESLARVSSFKPRD